MAKDEEEEPKQKDAPTVDPPPKKGHLSKGTVKVACGSCKKTVETEVCYENGHCAYIASLWLCVCIWSCPCCCLPLCPGVNFFKDAHHKCPECKTELGTFHRHYLSDV